MAPSDEAWIKGAEAMAAAPLAPGQLAPGQSNSPEVEKLSIRVHAQANAARGIPKTDRAEAYADLMLSCARCHAKLKRNPQ